MSFEPAPQPETDLQLSISQRLHERFASVRTAAGRIAVACFVMGGGLTTTVVESALHPAAAYADTIDDALQGYPDIDMACEHYPYLTTGPCDNYDWGPVPDTTLGWTESTTDSPRGYGYRNCTDWVAYRIFQVSGITIPSNLHDGGQWYNNAPAADRSAVPAYGEAAVEPGSPGHVAFIESVNSVDPSNPDDDTITVSEYNESGDGTGDQRTATAASMGFTEFVNFGVTLPESGPPYTDDDLIMTTTAPGGNVDFKYAVSYGDGSYGLGWTNRTDIPAPVAVATGDINGDHKADIVYAENAGNNEVSYISGLSNGDGTFGWSYTNLTDEPTVSNVLMGDFNGDGKDDLILEEPNSSGNIDLQFAVSYGNDTFGLGWTNRTNIPAPVAIAMGDYNGDGKDDIVYAENAGNNEVSIVNGLSNGDGTFGWSYSNLTDQTWVTNLLMGDFNGA